MQNTSRGLQERLISALARASLVLTLTVLGALFMSTAASAAAPVADVAAGQAGRPSIAGTILALLVLAVGVGILTYGALRSGSTRGDRPIVDHHLPDHRSEELHAASR